MCYDCSSRKQALVFCIIHNSSTSSLNIAGSSSTWVFWCGRQCTVLFLSLFHPLVLMVSVHMENSQELLTLSFVNTHFYPTLFLKLLRFFFSFIWFSLYSVARFALDTLSRKKLQHCSNLSLTSLFHTSRVLWFRIDFTWQFGRTDVAAGRPVGTHSSGASLYVLNGLQGMSLKLEDHLHQSLNASKDRSRVSVCPRPPLWGEGWRQGRRAGGGRDLGRTCSLELPPSTEFFRCAKAAGPYLFFVPVFPSPPAPLQQ